MDNNRMGDVIFIIAVLSLSGILFLTFGIQALTLIVWMVLLPLYIFRLIIWSKWDFWKDKLYRYTNPFLWKSSVALLWAFLALLVYHYHPFFLVYAFEMHILLHMFGFFLSLSGLFITFWTLWLLGIDRAILTTLIYGEEKIEQKEIIQKGPYALHPHPMFWGEKIIISGAFIFTGEVSIILLFIIALIANAVAARGEERDLLKKQGKDYQEYRKRTFLLRDKK